MKKSSKRQASKRRPNNAPSAGIPVVPRTAPASNNALGTLVGKAANIAKNIPVIGSIVDTAETVASSILSFLGFSSTMFRVTYDTNGFRQYTLHDHVSLDHKSNTASVPNSTIQPGAILMKYMLSIGPQGSRSRRMGENFEKFDLRAFQLSVTASCAATESGQLAYVFVPDPSDLTLDSMDSDHRLEAVLGRETMQLAQIWQSTLLTFKLPNRQFFVQPSDGDVRLASPGSVYVIAVTALDSTKLPTLRQTSVLRFSKATNAPTSSDVQSAMINLCAMNPPNGGLAIPDGVTDFSKVTPLRNSWNSEREVQMMALSSPSQEGPQRYTGSAVMAYKGEHVTCVVSVPLPQTLAAEVGDDSWYDHLPLLIGADPESGAVIDQSAYRNYGWAGDGTNWNLYSPQTGQSVMSIIYTIIPSREVALWFYPQYTSELEDAFAQGAPNYTVVVTIDPPTTILSNYRLHHVNSVTKTENGGLRCLIPEKTQVRPRPLKRIERKEEKEPPSTSSSFRSAELVTPSRCPSSLPRK